MATPNLPTTRDLLTSLISTIATSTNHHEQTPNPLQDTPSNTKSALLTLHTLFPNDFLPALDLLDRGLVTRFVLASSPHLSDDENQKTSISTTATTMDTTSNSKKHRKTLSYRVSTAQQPPSRSRPQTHVSNPNPHPQQSYEVHLEAWNCSCPAFAFAAFPATSSSTTSAEGQPGTSEIRGDLDEGAWLADAESEWRFGGLACERDPPVCKHLLACVVAERWRGFGGLVAEREVGGDEVGGWAAGWGD